ncbi:Cyclin F-box [Theobroma cacao]|uniref:Cyclin F-box n=1 Tax=Theobroma cacao TaxID=3641 RepID=A0A061ES84_THECC|nr:Cyclin F-box [Theobroma cacao]
MKNAKADWKNLPTLPLFLILEKLDVPNNLVRFGVVCKYWHSVFNNFLDSKRRSSLTLVPMLLIPSKKRNIGRKLYSLQAKAKIYSIGLPESHTKRSFSCCYGWLAAVDKKLVITLLNPFKGGITIDLPEIEIETYQRSSLGYQHDIKKVFLSIDPLLHPDDYIVVTIYSIYSKLAFYKPGQRSWIYLDKNIMLIHDVIFYKNLVYAIGSWNKIISFDVSIDNLDDTWKSPNLKTVISAQYQRLKDYIYRAHLFESSKGDLFSIYREWGAVDDNDHLVRFTKNFKVYKLVLDDQSGELLEEKEVKNINGDIVFVGNNQTLAVSALDFPEAQPNSIYFTDDYFIGSYYKPYGPRDIGFFNLQNGSMGKHYQFEPQHTFLSPYIWILPSVKCKLGSA